MEEISSFKKETSISLEINLILVKDGTRLLSVGADKAGRMMDVTTGQTTQVAAHDAPIKCVRFVDANIAVTAGWDKAIKVSNETK